MKNAFCLLVAAMLSSASFAEDETVMVTGIGSTYRSAVNEALVTALEMRQGVTFSSTEKSEILSSATSVSSSSGDEDKAVVNDAIKKSMEKWASGKISGYEVVSDEFDAQAKKYRVQLVVHMPGRYVVGLAGTEAGVAVAPLVAAFTPQLHRHADDLVPGALQQKRGDCGVDAARKPDSDLHGLLPRRRAQISPVCVSSSSTAILYHFPRPRH